MRKAKILISAILAAMLLSPLASTADELTLKQRAENAANQLIGKPAPALVLKTLDGKMLDLAQYYGKRAVYLKLWATWCVPCRAQMPHFTHAFEAAGDDMAVIAIDAGFNETRADIDDAITEFGLRMPVVVDDGTLATQFGMQMTPQHVVIDRSGIIRYLGQAADEKLDAALQAAKTAPRVERFSAAAPPASVRAVSIGDVVPALSVTTLDQRKIPLRDSSKSRGTALVFMNSWCESYLAKSRPDSARACTQVREQVEQLKRAQPDLHWVTISGGLWTSAADLRLYAQENHIAAPLTLDEDGQLFRRFGVQRVPTVIVADAKGKIVNRSEGYDAELGLKLKRL